MFKFGTLLKFKERVDCTHVESDGSVGLSGKYFDAGTCAIFVELKYMRSYVRTDGLIVIIIFLDGRIYSISRYSEERFNDIIEVLNVA